VTLTCHLEPIPPRSLRSALPAPTAQLCPGGLFPAALPPEARAKVRAAQLLPSPALARGDSCRLVGLTKSLRIMQRSSVVTNATVALTIPLQRCPGEPCGRLDAEAWAWQVCDLCCCCC